MKFIEDLPNTKIEELENDHEKLMEYYAMMFAICLDEDPTFIDRVTRKRRKFIDRLLVDIRLID
jgi:alcohol dehydrogenase YqhD (iron-dependent ADH family)